MSARSISYTGYSDAQLLPLITTGNSMAFDELYFRYGQKIFSYFFRMLWKNKELAEDCTQDLFLKIIRHAEIFDQEKRFSTWLYSIAHNMCKNEYRKKEVRMNHLAINRENPASVEAADPDMNRFRLAVQACSNALSEEKKSLYILRFTENLTVPEISSILSIPEGTVKSRIFYLLKEMKEQLKEFETLLVYP